MEHETNFWNSGARAGFRPGLFILLITLAAALSGVSFSVQAQLYRWVDENGEVHYSESLPPDIKDKQHDRYDDEGSLEAADLTLKPDPVSVQKLTRKKKEELPRDASGLKRAKPLYSAKELAARMDRLLLLRYESEQEILDAMKVETNQLGYDERLLAKTRESIKKSYSDEVKEAADRERSGRKVEPKSINTMAHLRERLKNNRQSMKGLKARQAQIEAQFNIQLKRYRALVEKNAREES